MRCPAKSRGTMLSHAGKSVLPHEPENNQQRKGRNKQRSADQARITRNANHGQENRGARRIAQIAHQSNEALSSSRYNSTSLCQAKVWKRNQMSDESFWSKLLRPAVRQKTQARSGLPFVREWCAQANRVFDPANLRKVVGDYPSRPILSKVVRDDLCLIQSDQAQMIANAFAKELPKAKIAVPNSVAVFNVVSPDLASAIAKFAEQSSDVRSDLAASGLGWAVFRDMAKMRAVPVCVANHVISASSSIMGASITIEGAKGSDPAVERTARQQIYTWIRATRPSAL